MYLPQEKKVLVICQTYEDTACQPATFVTQLKLCANQRDLHTGTKLHAELARTRLVQRNVFVASSLINLYAKCKALTKAQEVFDELPVRNVILWTVLIAGYTQNGHAKEALDCFRRMQHEGLYPDATTFACILKACGSLQAVSEGQRLHAEILKEGLLEENVMVANAAIDMYAKCAFLGRAEQLFDELPSRNVVSWNTMLTGYVENGVCDEALNCFEQMQLAGLCADHVTFLCTLKACGILGAVWKGQEIHDKILRDGFSDGDIILGTVLVDMYASCGMLAEAQEVFEKLSNHDIVVWNAFISGYTLLGKSDSVFDSLVNMMREGIEPSSITYNIVLNACSYEGLIEESQIYFKRMSTRGYGIISSVEHYTCMLDLFCRAGLLEMVMTLIEEMPFIVDLTAWQTVLDACQKWGNMKFGMWAFKHAILLDDKDPAAYVCLSNM